MALSKYRLLNLFRFHSTLYSVNYLKYLKAWRSTDISAGRDLISVHKGLFGQPNPSTHPHLIDYGDVTPGVSKQEYLKRRKNLMTLIKTNSSESHNAHLVIIPSATKQYMTADIPYPFRQNTDFLYLSGFKEPDSILLLENKPGCHSDIVKSTLFVPKKNPDKELWDGPRSGIEGSIILTGIDEAVNNDEFNNYMRNYKSNANVCVWYDADIPTHTRFHQSIVDSVIMRNWVDKVENVRHMVHQLRLVKSDAECALMEHGCHITSESFRDVIRYTAPQTDEAFLQALMEYSVRIRGAQGLAYPPVVASGHRANIIHYINNDQVVKDGDLVLLDAGCEFNGYSSDVTRTYPALGHFGARQEELYESLLWVHDQLVFMCVAGTSIDILYNHMLSLLARQLKQLCIIPKYLDGEDLFREVKVYCPHDVGHYLGMDIHDTPTVSRHTPLAPGMVITVEPGLYISESDTSAPPEWRGVGMRIEDNILITDGLPKNLTSFTPKTVSELEGAMINTS